MKRRYPEPLLHQVAAHVRDVHGSQPHALAVADRFGGSISHARRMIAAARHLGLEVPADCSKWRYARSSLVCECGWSCPVDHGLIGLQRHTLPAHGRNPLMVERVPKLVVA